MPDKHKLIHRNRLTFFPRLTRIVFCSVIFIVPCLHGFPMDPESTGSLRDSNSNETNLRNTREKETIEEDSPTATESNNLTGRNSTLSVSGDSTMNSIPNQVATSAGDVTEQAPPQAAHAPILQAQGNFEGAIVRELTPAEARLHEIIAPLDHTMQLVGNPLRTLGAILESSSCCVTMPLSASLVLSPNEVATIHNALVEQWEDLQVQEARLANPRINQNLPELLRCRECLGTTVNAFAEVFRIEQRRTSSLEEYTEAVETASHEYTDFAAAVHALTNAQRALQATSPPGAYHVSAAEAAAMGQYAYFDAPIREIPVAEALTATVPDRIQLSDTIIARTAQTPLNRDGIPVVRPEEPTSILHGIPVAEATIVPPAAKEKTE